MNEQTQTQTVARSSEGLARVIKIKPGTASEKSIKLILPEDKYNTGLNQIIRYALSEQSNRGDERIADRIRAEMGNAYGITVNSNKVEGSQSIGKLFTKKQTNSGIDYLEAEIIVAADQEGGLKYSL